MVKEKITKKDIQLIVIGLIIGFFGEMYLSNTIGEPIENLLFPPQANISLRVMEQPVIKDGDHYARFLIVNTGEKPITKLFAEYNFLCTNTGNKPASLEKNILGNKGDSTYFDVAFDDVGLNYTCSPNASIDLRFFADEKGNIYCATQEVVQKPCVFCVTNIIMISNEIPNPIKTTIMYPFSEGELILSVGGKNCLTLEELEKINVTEIKERRIVFTAHSFAEYCLRGEIDLEWCKEHGYV